MSILPDYKISPLGDSALLVDFGNRIDEGINDLVLELFFGLKQLDHSGLKDVVPAYGSLAVHYDPKFFYGAGPTAFEVVAELAEVQIRNLKPGLRPQQELIEIPVCYATEFAPDIEAVSAQTKLSADEIIRIHSSKIYRVYMIGFLPGFPYMGTVDDALIVPRKEKPRQVVAAGSVGIAGRQTGIYSLDSPGGWQIIGRTPYSIFDATKESPVVLAPGDRIRFYSISRNEFEDIKGGSA
jgi:inhibitor of KinA